MARRKKVETVSAPKPNAHWIIQEEIQVNGRNVIKGTELKIKGERGRFRFSRRVDTGTAIWVDVWGGPKGAECMRSFREERIKTVHYKNKTDHNLAKEYKAKQKIKKAEEAEDAE